MTDTAKTSVPETGKARLKKGEGPIVTLFVDKDGKEVARPQLDGGHTVIFKDRLGNSQTVDLEKLDGKVKYAALAAFVKQRVEGLVRTTGDAHGNNDKGENIVLPTIKSALERIMSGEIFVRADAGEKGPKGPRGRPFDTDLWVDAMRNAMEIKAKSGQYKADAYVKDENGKATKELRTDIDVTPYKYKAATQEQLDALRVKLEATAPADRKKMTDRYLTDKIIAFAVAKIKADRLAASATAEIGEDMGL